MTHTPSQMPELKRCPFCAVQPKLEIEADDDGYEYGGAWSYASISAVHEKTCPLYQSQELGDNSGSIQIVDFSNENLERFINAWNTRAASVPSDKERAAIFDELESWKLFLDRVQEDPNTKAKRAIKTIISMLTEQDHSGIWNDEMKRAAMADSAKVCKQDETIKALVAALNACPMFAVTIYDENMKCSTDTLREWHDTTKKQALALAEKDGRV